MGCLSEGKDKDVYLNKALFSQKNLVRHLSENKNTCFKVVYDNCTSKLIEVLKGKYYKDMTFKDTIDLVKQTKGIDVKFDKEMNDPNVYKQWQEGNSVRNISV